MKTLGSLALLGILALGVIGCGSAEEKDFGGQVTSGPSPQNTEAQIKAIQDNPNIPADAKEKAIAALQRGGGGASAAGGAK